MFKDHHTGPQKALFGAEAPVPEVFSPLNPELCCHARALRQEQEVRLRTISAPY